MKLCCAWLREKGGSALRANWRLGKVAAIAPARADPGNVEKLMNRVGHEYEGGLGRWARLHLGVFLLASSRAVRCRCGEMADAQDLKLCFCHFHAISLHCFTIAEYLDSIGRKCVFAGNHWGRGSDPETSTKTSTRFQRQKSCAPIFHLHDPRAD